MDPWPKRLFATVRVKNMFADCHNGCLSVFVVAVHGHVLSYSYSRSEATEEVLSRGYLEVCMFVCLSVTNDVVNITVTRSSLKKTEKKSRIKLQLLT